MIETKDLPIRQPSEAYVFRYEAPAEIAKTQRSVFWTPEEINVDGDKQDFLVNMSFAEQEAIKTTLKLFTMYELLLNEAWGSRIYNDFPRPETQMMSSTFAMMENSVHSVFYSNLNKVLMIDNEDFYLSYKNDPILAERIKFVNDAIASEDLMLSIAAFTLLENCVLYSNFAFIKHYQSNGKDMIKNVVSGINFSARDEEIHAQGAAWLFNQTLSEYKDSVSKEEYGKEEKLLHDHIYELANHLYEHEARIVDMLFSNGPIPGITADSLKEFIKSRINLTLLNLNLEEVFKVEDNPVAEWFYAGVSGISQHDFFAITGNSYRRDWDEKEFTF